MQELATTITKALRKGWLRSRPVFEPYAPVSSADLAAIEGRVGRSLPNELREWLLTVGYGDLDRSLSFRSEWFQLIESGELKGGILFAQDELGSFYGCGPGGDSVVYFSRSEPVFATLAPSFKTFLRELAGRDYKILEWVESIEAWPYAWAAV